MKPKFLIDTHIWIWYAKGDRKHLSFDAVKQLEAWDEQSALIVSVMSVWELGLLDAKQRIHLGQPIAEWLEAFFTRTHFQTIGLDIPIVLDANQLPGTFHPDPIDRILVATTRHHEMTLLTEDKKILEYAEQGYVRACSSSQTQFLDV